MKLISGIHVYDREEIQTQTQTVIISTCVGLAYKTVLEYLSDKVTARYIDYEGNPVDYNGEIIFEFEGEQQTVQAINGVAEIPFEVVDSGVYVVKTANPDIDNGEVTINV